MVLRAIAKMLCWSFVHSVRAMICLPCERIVLHMIRCAVVIAVAAAIRIGRKSLRVATTTTTATSARQLLLRHAYAGPCWMLARNVDDGNDNDREWCVVFALHVVVVVVARRCGCAIGNCVVGACDSRHKRTLNGATCSFVALHCKLHCTEEAHI